VEAVYKGGIRVTDDVGLAGCIYIHMLSTGNYE
jgi:hypothetical protein